MLLEKIYYLVRISFGTLFIYASLDKLAFPQQFIEIVSNYQILPEFASKIVGFILPLGELILGTLLLVGLYVEVASGGLVVLTIFFTIALILRLFQEIYLIVAVSLLHQIARRI